MKTLKRFGVGGALAVCGLTASHAQSAVTLYGVIDQYLHYMHSSSGASVKSLEDGGWLG